MSRCQGLRKKRSDCSSGAGNIQDETVLGQQVVPQSWETIKDYWGSIKEQRGQHDKTPIVQRWDHLSIKNDCKVWNL